MAAAMGGVGLKPTPTYEMHETRRDGPGATASEKPNGN